MATSKPTLKDARPAGADLSDALYLLVKMNSDGNFIIAGEGDTPYGSVYEAAPQGQRCTVDVEGIIKVKLSGSITAGDKVACAASGLASAVGTGDTGFATARMSGADGDIISVLKV